MAAVGIGVHWSRKRLILGGNFWSREERRRRRKRRGRGGGRATRNNHGKKNEEGEGKEKQQQSFFAALCDGRRRRRWTARRFTSHYVLTHTHEKGSHGDDDDLSRGAFSSSLCLSPSPTAAKPNVYIRRSVFQIETCYRPQPVSQLSGRIKKNRERFRLMWRKKRESEEGVEHKKIQILCSLFPFPATLFIRFRESPPSYPLQKSG